MTEVFKYVFAYFSCVFFFFFVFSARDVLNAGTFLGISCLLSSVFLL